MSFDLESYVDVASRLAEFRTKHPDGSLQPADPAVPYRVEKIGEQTYIVVVAAAYRSPDDARPGVGMAYEQFPGRTPYTKGSELQNAETSAWGRAIVAALAADTRRGVASQEEVRNRHAERDTPAGPPTPTGEQVDAWLLDFTTRVANAPDKNTLRAGLYRGLVGKVTAGWITAAEGHDLQAQMAGVAERLDADEAARQAGAA